MKVRLLPIVREACTVLSILNAWHSGVDESKLPDKVKDAIAEGLIIVRRDSVIIRTLHGPVDGGMDDYVLVGEGGDVWPVAKAQFADTYEVLEA